MPQFRVGVRVRVPLPHPGNRNRNGRGYRGARQPSPRQDERVEPVQVSSLVRRYTGDEIEAE